MFARALPVLLVATSSGGCFAAADELTEESRQVSGFTVVRASISGAINLEAGGEEGLRIEAKQETLDRIVTEVDDGVLRIEHKSDGGWWRDSGPIRIHISYRQLDGLEMSGSADVVTDAIDTSDFAVQISGSSNIQIPGMAVDALRVRVSGSGDLDVQALRAEAVNLGVSGSGDVALAGSTDELSIAVNGSGNVDAVDLEARQAEVTVSGSGDVAVRAEEDLEVRISGSGNVEYTGDADLTSRISGSGDLQRR